MKGNQTPRYDLESSVEYMNDGSSLDRGYEDPPDWPEPLEINGFVPRRRNLHFKSLGASTLPRLRVIQFRRKMRRTFCVLIIGYLSMTGLFHILGNTLHHYFPDEMDLIVHPWIDSAAATIGVGHWLSDSTMTAQPVRCHSHNDYLRNVPLLEAISAGCPSVEADVWNEDDDLYVAHRHFQLEANHTLESLYINPLLGIFDRQRDTFSCGREMPCHSPSTVNEPLAGVFESDPDRPLVVLIDFKTEGNATWEKLQRQLEPLRRRNLLTHFNGTAIVPGPVVIVGTGNTPFDKITENNTYRDVFYDAPLDLLADTTYNGEDIKVSDKYNPYNSYYASAHFKKAVGHVWGSRLSQEQLQRIRAQIHGAHRLGLKARYFSVPAWPVGLRNHIWHILTREGVDVLSVDDLRQATTWDWRKKKGLFF
ncbi:Altered inheritance of mitochondria protein 6 [Fusarium oxysporum f. sp. cubense race 1]|uniref:Altered inheritance of mitochondria protein 6 n=1 Tax=Fusarium oxysporum f. sp. cubense (strain race 1) TaxID=1229664 RepID=N4UKV0_FUSC1|nr:Altered inheritance of mitochondria protein 6 [Fusarium oxysporum f. sp. cubense race 1]